MPHVAIVGAGIGGLAAALSLARAGCRITVFEKVAALAEVGAGLQLSPNAAAVLRRLDVLDAVERQAVRLSAVRIGRGRDGAVLARLPLGQVAEERFGAPFLVTRRADLHDALLGAAAAHRDVLIETGHAVSGWSQAGAAIRIELGSSRSVTVDGVVGADGLHSVVRGQLHPTDRAAYGRRTAWRATVEAAALPGPFSEPCSNLWLGPKAHLVHYPVAAGRLVNIVAALDEPEENAALRGSWSSPGDPAEIAARFAAWAGPLRDLIAAAPTWRVWPLADRMPIDRWSCGPVTLLGDAAHPMLPFLAQGAAQALEDAEAIGEAVRRHGQDLARAFEDYEARRRARTARVQAQSRRQAGLYHLGGPAAAVRDFVLARTPGRRLLDRYNWLYAFRADAG